jgi:hypothetical protein
MNIPYNGLKGAIVRFASIIGLSIMGMGITLLLITFVTVLPTANLQNGAGFSIGTVKIFMIAVGMFIGVIVSLGLIDIPISDKTELRVIIVAILPTIITCYYFSGVVLNALS